MLKFKYNTLKQKIKKIVFKNKFKTKLWMSKIINCSSLKQHKMSMTQ